MLSARPATTLRRVTESEPTPRPGPLARARATVGKYGFLIVLVVAVGGGIALGIRQGGGGGEQSSADPTTAAPPLPFQSEQEAAQGQPTKDVFAHTCGTCHTLRRANVKGIIGPDLDKVVLTTAGVREMIRTGSLDTVMPRNLLVGEDADRVAAYVARQSLASRRARARARRG